MRFPPTAIPAEEISGELLPRLNPNYWDGHVLGDDSGEKPEAPVSTVSQVDAMYALEAALKWGSADGSLKFFEEGDAFGSGDTFVSEENEPGTVVMLNKEELFRARRAGPYADMTWFLRGDMPEPPSSLDIDFSQMSLFRSEGDDVEDAGIIYYNAVRLGIVAPDHEGHSRLYSVSHSCANRDFWSDDQVVLGAVGNLVRGGRTLLGRRVTSVVEPEPLTVGEVRHYSGRRPEDERLERVNILVATAMPQTLEAPELIAEAIAS
ncbi:MAG TPA: hypothetical protein VFW77_02525 [Candidatus Saccharimonadales bacterium]|nr:hypothetical protein [Candidatus Saccharimonadales bacterium]